MVSELEFECLIVELWNKIVEFKEFVKNIEVDLFSEIDKLENCLEKVENDIYNYLSLWNCV